MPLRSSASTANRGAPQDPLQSRLNTTARKQEDGDFGADSIPARKPPSAFPTFTMNTLPPQEQSPNVGSKPSVANRRRQSAGLHAKPPSGPRPLDLQKRSTSGSITQSYGSLRGAPVVPSQNPYVNDFSINDITQFSFAVIDPTNTVPQEALRQDDPMSVDSFSEPNFDFDVFHDNIGATSPRYDNVPLPIDLSQFDIPDIPDIPDLPALPKFESKKFPTQPAIPIPTRKASGAGSIGRKTSAASNAGRLNVGKAEPMSQTAGATSILRGRRQTQFPPNAFNNAPPPAPTTATTKAPRKSIGPGTFLPLDPAEGTETYRGTNINGRKSSAESSASIMTTGIFDRSGKNSRNGSKSPRTVKARTGLAPMNRASKDLLTPSKTPDGPRTVSMAIQTTPNRRSGTPGRTTTPGGNGRRQSMATGLGARTISPTDARRLKRMSMVPPAPPLPQSRISQAPPTPQPDLLLPTRPRSTVQSPAAADRTSVTPSSPRTTPDPNRKSYSSGQPLSSSTSYFSARNSANIAVRLLQSISTSRLPTPKPRTETASTPPTEEEIPPVPAIPKSYESPASELDQPFFSARSSSLQRTDTPTSDTHSVSSAIEAFARLNIPNAMFSTALHSDQSTEAARKPSLSVSTPDLLVDPPMRLPPLNLLPLSTPTSDRILSFKSSTTRPTTPPDTKHRTKTPSTPMTASKATFFSKVGRGGGQTQNAIPRSSTSHFVVRSDHHDGGPSPGLPVFAFESDAASHRSVSPFLSASAPKDSGEFPNYMRLNFNTELKRTSTQARPNGPRAPSYSLPAKTVGVTAVSKPVVESNVIHPTSLLQRTLSKKKSGSKILDVGSTSGDAAKFNNMPPPKLPASATWANLAYKAASPTQQKTGFFRSRRKTSASSTVTLSELERQNSMDSTASKVPQSAIGRPSMDSIKSFMLQPNKSASLLSSGSAASGRNTQPRVQEPEMDRDDMAAEEEMKRLASKRRDFESAARELDALRARARPASRASAATALQNANLNIFERGEVVDYPDVYFTGTKNSKKIVGDLASSSSNFGYDDDRGDYNIIKGDHLAYRYEVIDLLGKGSFGQVVRCIDHKTGILVAIKIIRNKKRFHQQALVEVDILQKLKEWDPQKKFNVVDFDQSFYFRSHLCISTDLLSMNLYEFIKAHDFRGFSLKLIRRFTKQMLGSLILLHGKKVIHCDLKPENILLAHPAQSEIKVIDFGSSCFENEKVYTYIQSRFYRSPEVILGMSYGMPIDMWSLGCILAELFTGYPVFPGENEQEQLACIMEVFGPPEKHLIEKSSRKKLFFDSMGKPRLTVSSKGRRRRPSSKDLRQVLKCDDEAFLDFIARCLRWDPARRMSPHEAIRHEFISGIKATPISTRKHITSALSTPLKRGNSVTTPGGVRPLPQPPLSQLKPLFGSRQELLAPSPNKASTRRQSNVNGPQATVQAKRASHAAMNTTTNANLGRIAAGQRNASSRSDLAAAAAAASLVK